MPAHAQEITPDQNRKLFEEVKAQVMAQPTWWPEISNAPRDQQVSFAVIASYEENDGTPTFYVTVDPFRLEVAKVELDYYKPGSSRPTATFVGTVQRPAPPGSNRHAS